MSNAFLQACYWNAMIFMAWNIISGHKDHRIPICYSHNNGHSFCLCQQHLRFEQWCLSMKDNFCAMVHGRRINCMFQYEARSALTRWDRVILTCAFLQLQYIDNLEEACAFSLVHLLMFTTAATTIKYKAFVSPTCWLSLTKSIDGW